MQPVKPIVVTHEIATQDNSNEAPPSRSSFFANIFNNLSNMLAKVRDYGNCVIHVLAVTKKAIISKVSAIFRRIINYFEASCRDNNNPENAPLSQFPSKQKELSPYDLRNPAELRCIDENLQDFRKTLDNALKNLSQIDKVSKQDEHGDFLDVTSGLSDVLSDVKLNLTAIYDSLTQPVPDILEHLNHATEALKQAIAQNTLNSRKEYLTIAIHSLSDAEKALNGVLRPLIIQARRAVASSGPANEGSLHEAGRIAAI